jgi:rhomboid protease GluP
MSFESPEVPPILQPAHDEAAYREARAEEEFILRLRTSRPWATTALIASCLVVFALECLWAQMGESMDGLFSMGAMVGAAVHQGEWWRLWAATFLHIGVLHIVMNMMVLWNLGRQMEAIFGARRFLIIYALSGLAGSIPFLFVDQEVVCAGASGAIWGLLAGMYALTLRPQGLMPPGIAHRARGRLVQPLLINLAISFLPGIGLWAHMGGGVAGFGIIFAGLLGGQPEAKAEFPGGGGWMGQWTTWAAAALSAAMLISVAWAIWAGQPWGA